MASTALAKAKRIAHSSRLRAREEIAKREHTMLSSAAAAMLGVAEAKGHKLPVVFGIDGTVAFGAAAVLLADNVGGNTGRMLQSLGDGLLAIGMYKMGRSVGGAAIAGAGDAPALEAILSA